MSPVGQLVRRLKFGELYVRAAAGAVLPDALWGGSDSLPGDVLELWDQKVSQEDLYTYCELTGFRPGLNLPDTYPSLPGFPLGLRLMTDRRFPLQALGMVHVQERLRIRRPIAADESLSFTVRAQDLRTHRRGDLVDLVTEITSRGEVVWTEISTYLSKGSRVAPQQAEPTEAAAGDALEPTGRVPTPPDASTAEVIEVEADLGRRFAAVSGDRNPIHLYPLTARLFGFARPIAHGRWTMARSVAAVANDYAYPVQIDTWFRAPVALPAMCLLVSATNGDTTEVWLTDAERTTTHAYTKITPL